MLRSSLVSCALLALLVPVTARSVPAIRANPAELEPNSEATVQLIVDIDSKDAVMVGGSLQALGGTKLTGIKELQVKGGAAVALQNPQGAGYVVGDAVTPLPEGSLPFAVVEISTGEAGDHLTITGASFLLSDGSEASLPDELLIKVGGDVPPNRPPLPSPAARPAPAAAPPGALAPAPSEEPSSGVSFLDRLFSPLGGLVLAAIIMVAVYVASRRLGQGSG
jgi:hypothetical protein